MAITLDDLRRAGIGTNGMNPNVIQVADLSIRGLPQNAPQQAPMPQQMPQQAPQQAPQQRRGLLGGLFGPEGRDARARLAIGLEGLTMNPNQALIGQLQGGIEERKADAERNRTLEWLSKLNTPEATRALQYVQATGDIVGAVNIALKPGATLEDPAAFRALDLTARTGGLKPKSEGGDGRYEEFMITSGAGLRAGAAATAKAEAEKTAGAPQQIALYNTIEFQVNDLLNDPYLPSMLGPVQSRLPNLTGDAERVQSKMDQISGGAFLTARQLLKGGGAITDFESKKAETAFIRLNAAQNEGDFRQAMQDFLDAVKSGLPKLEGAAPAAAPAGGTAAPIRLQYDSMGNLIQ